MTTFDFAAGHQPLTPPDPDLDRRRARLQALGLGDERPIADLDHLARILARSAANLIGIANAPFAMVNVITGHQFFAGLYEPAPATTGIGPQTARPASSVGRIMSRDHGYCPHVINRRTALVLDDVCAFARFKSNPVADELGIRTYLGAPLIDEQSGTVLGTVCVVDTQPRPWGRPGLALIKDFRDQAMARIRQADHHPW
ncbi:GAF domain-containing protein [Kitasatospora indigofera]|uniref:GAF domain-containing protein n=1 Tax=Kitasatospora indigofera TaxID=67307 RepID=UPI0036A76B9E